MHREADWRHQLHLAAEPRSAARVRAFVSGHLLAHHLADLVEPIRLVASELATNAIVHARTEFLVTLLRTEGRVVVSVEDDQPDLPPPGPGAGEQPAPSPTTESGRGLRLVEAMSQEWGTSGERRGSKAVWAAFPARDVDSHGHDCTCRSSHPSAQHAAPVLRLVPRGD